MTAVLNGQFKVVEILLQSGLSEVKECLTIRDAEGSMPLHAAVHRGYAKIVSLLIEAAPDSEAIYSENGVGETPLETARARFLISATREKYPGNNLLQYGGVQQLGSSYFGGSRAIKQERDLSKEVELLKSVQASLLEHGKLAANPKLKDALEEFIPYLAEKARAEAEWEEIPEDEQTKDKCDCEETFKVVSAAVANVSGRRRLVHLTDVQRSVRTSLEKANKKREDIVENDFSRKRRFLKGDEIPDEVEAEQKEKQEMWSGIFKDCYSLRSLANVDRYSYNGY